MNRVYSRITRINTNIYRDESVNETSMQMKKIGVYFGLLFILLLFILLLPIAFGAPISAVTDKLTYVVGDRLSIDGNINTTGGVSLTLRIYNSSYAIMNTSTTTSSGGNMLIKNNTFSFRNVINDTYTPGYYSVSVTDGTDTANMTFRVVSQPIILESHFITGDVINISTDTVLQTGNENYSGGNFTELLNLSLSSPQRIHYGNYSIGGKLYHFVLVDQGKAGVYDRVYVDDDTNFALFNDTEDDSNFPDIEQQALRIGSKFTNNTFTYLVGEIERTTGEKILLWKPPSGKPPYSTNDNINFVVLAKNSTHLLSNQGVTIDILNSTGLNVTPTLEGTTNSFGWFNKSVRLPDVLAGFYVISLNDSLGTTPFPVEAFKLFVSVTDLSDNPTSSFAPNSNVRIRITSKNTTGIMNLTSLTMTVYYPTGTILTKTKSNFVQPADGVYYYDINLTNAPLGAYSVSVSGSDITNNQSTIVGFSVQSVSFDATAVNIRYVEEAEGPGAEVNAFAPDTNVTIMTFLQNISAGGIRAKGPEGFRGLVKPENCNASVSVIDVVDENGLSYAVDYRSMDLTGALNYLSPVLGGETPRPPEQFKQQCMIIFPTPNKTGVFRAKIKMTYRGQELFSGVTFGVQRLWATGSTVDFRGDDFAFLSPNTTIRIKLKIRDLATDQYLSASNITSVKIIKMYKEFPLFRDVLGNSTSRELLNESVENGTISFLAPNDEGFFSMQFRFSANVNNKIEAGIGNAFFMLKKYMIWGQLSSAQTGQWFVKSGENITLQVTVIDIDKAQTAFGFGSSTRTCTGCTGFVINVSEIRNDQQFKVVSDYTVQTGTITNGSNPVTTITIIPTPGGDMTGGWYSVDLIATSTDSTYFGWGWFEIRNFWIDTRAVQYDNNTHYTASGGGDRGPGSSAQYAVGQPIYFAVMPSIPGFPPQVIRSNDISSINVENVRWFDAWPPLPVSGYSASASVKNVTKCERDWCSTSLAYVFNLTGLPSDKQGNFQVDVKVTVNGTSDTGSFLFSVSSYQVETTYRMNSFPPLFASTENLTVNFTATDFDGNPHNITNVTIDQFFSTKQGRPIKFTYGQDYWVDCNLTSSHNKCKVDVNLSVISNPSGEYDVTFDIIDNESTQKTAEVFFRIQGAVLSIPSIEETWVWSSDRPNKKIDNGVMKGEWSNCGREAVGSNIKLCGEYWSGHEGQVRFNITVSNVSYNKEIFGYIPLMEEWSVGQFGSVADKSRMYMYSNGSHLWINITPNLTETRPITIGEMFTDDKGGMWNLTNIGDQDITVYGLNTLYSTGVLINTSFSRSGIFKLGQIRENELGAYTSQGRAGIDLDGDGFTNGTVYFAISDNVTAGVYDTFFFSRDGNFTGNVSSSLLNPISVSATDRTNKEFGFGAPNQRLTLLSIDPKAQTLRFYSKQVGDWSDLGETKLNSNITIPVIIQDPAGISRTEDVSIVGYKNTRNGVFTRTNLVTKTIDGIGELTFNTSQIGVGEFTFAVSGNSSGVMEEWKWPRATVRGFLIDGELGEGVYISNFKPLRINRYRWDTPGIQITRVQSDRRNSSDIVDGVITNAHAINPDQEGCQFYGNSSPMNFDVYPILKDDNSDQVTYYLYNSTISSSSLYKNSTCVFDTQNLGTAYREGSTLVIGKWGRNYNVTVLRIDKHDASGGCAAQGGCWRADFGVAGINSSVIEPMVNNPYGDPSWRVEWGYMQNVSISGNYYDVILANDTTYTYQRCVIDPPSDGQCAKKAWLVSRNIGNFSDSSVKNVTIGQNFTTDLYLVSIGPYDNEGISVGNFSEIASLNLSLTSGRVGPGIGDVFLADSTLSYFAKLNESELSVDLDKNSAMNATFYMFTFDNVFDGKQNLTGVLIDDDLEIAPMCANVGGSCVQIDFSGNEYYTGVNSSWTYERWENLPTGTWDGHARFGDNYAGREWDQQPEWSIPFYNNTHMILKKPMWRVQTNQKVGIVMKVFDFDQSPISGANITINRVNRMSTNGFSPLIRGEDYTVDDTYNVTDSYGFGLLQLQPTSSWTDGEYQVQVSVQGTGGTETFERWFCVGACR